MNVTRLFHIKKTVGAEAVLATAMKIKQRNNKEQRRIGTNVYRIARLRERERTTGSDTLQF